MLEVIRWVTMAIMWVCIAANWWLIWRNYKLHKEYEKLIEAVEENLMVVMNLRDRYEALLGSREEASCDAESELQETVEAADR